jgi:inosine-uridine nucleoside N-ribohydrolase
VYEAQVVRTVNYFADPYAVREILEPEDPILGFPLDRFLLVPLDITTVHELSFPLYTAKVDKSFVSVASPSDPRTKLPLNHLTSSFLEGIRELMLQYGNDAMTLHDPVAVWCAIQNPPAEQETIGQGLILARRRQFQVERY